MFYVNIYSLGSLASPPGKICVYIRERREWWGGGCVTCPGPGPGPRDDVLIPSIVSNIRETPALLFVMG